MNLHEMTALELGAQMKSGRIGAPDVTRATLARIAAQNGESHAMITVTDAVAMAQAEALQVRLDRGEVRWPLAGVPMALKDNICTRGIRTTCASRMLETFVPQYSATLTERLEAAGAVLVGKANMDEFAMGSTSETSHFGPVKNPWNMTRSAGGSSGGSAAAVAAGVCWYAIGSDTGGSIRQPAAHCGVTGMKPTYGTVSRYGLVAHASSMDQMGPIARSAADCAAVLDVIRGRDVRDGTSLDVPVGGLLEGLSGDLRGVKIGLLDDCFGVEADPAVGAAILATAEVLRGRGALVERLSLPVMRDAIPTYYILAAAEVSANLAKFDGVKYGHRATSCTTAGERYRQSRTQGFGLGVKRRILLGTLVLSGEHYDTYYKKALETRGLIGRVYGETFQKYDLLLTPVAPTTAPKLGESGEDIAKTYRSDCYTAPVNLAGLPAISIPCGFDANAMPIGAQLIGPALKDGAVLSAAYAFQQDTDYHRQVPKEGGAE